MNVLLWPFWGLLVLYSVVSAILLFITSSGWTSFIFILPATIIFYSSLIFISFVLTLVLYTVGGRMISISRKHIYILLGLQLITLLLNTGDCGDNEATLTFIFRVFLPDRMLCKSDYIFSSPLMVTLALSLIASLAVVTLGILAKAYWEARPANKSLED